MQEILQKHKFYVILGGVLVVYLLAYLIFVSPLDDDIKYELTGKGKRRKIKRKKRKKGQKPIKRVKFQGLIGKKKNLQKYDKEELPSDALVTEYKKYKAGIEENVRKVEQYFAQKDQDFEKWFREIQEGLGETKKEIDVHRFRQYYKNNVAALVNEYSTERRKLKITSGEQEGPIRSERILEIFKTGLLDSIAVDSDIQVEEDARNWQKKFWLVKGLLKLLEQGRMNSLSVLNIQVNEGGKQRGKKKEVTLRRGVFREYKIMIRGKMVYSNIPFLLASVLNGKKIYFSDFEVNDFLKATKLVDMIKAAEDPVSAYIKRNLEEKTLRRLLQQEIASKRFLDILAKDLNQQILRSIYNPNRFKDVKLRAETQALLKERSSDKDRRRLNKLLFMTVYAEDIREKKKKKTTEEEEKFQPEEEKEKLPEHHLDIKRIKTSFLSKIIEPQDPISTYLRKNLSQELQKKLKKYKGKAKQKWLKRIIEDINRMIEEEDFYHEKHYAKMDLKQEIVNLIEKRLPHNDLMRLNRLLLEDKYSGMIADTQTLNLMIEIEKLEVNKVLDYKTNEIVVKVPYQATSKQKEEAKQKFREENKDILLKKLPKINVTLKLNVLDYFPQKKK